MQTQKTRTFYIVHLDRFRILIVGVLFVTLLFLSYSLGRRTVENGHAGADDSGRISLADAEPKRNPKSLSKDRLGFSIYERQAPGDDAYIAEERPQTRREASLHSLKNTKRNTNKDSVLESRRAFRLVRRKTKKERRQPQKSRKSRSKKLSRHTHRPKRTRKTKKVAGTSAQKRSKQKKVSHKDKKLEKRKFSRKEKKARRETASSQPQAPLLSSKKGSSLHLANTSRSSRFGYYSLQTGSFHSKAAARRMSEGLKKQGFRPRLLQGRGTWVVRLGRETEPRRLWKLENRLRSRNYAPVRVRER